MLLANTHLTTIPKDLIEEKKFADMIWENVMKRANQGFIDKNEIIWAMEKLNAIDDLILKLKHEGNVNVS